MSLLPPSLSTPSTPAPAQTGSASSASSAAPGRGDEAGQGDAPSFGDVLSRSLAASGESAAKAGGKPAATVAVKRAADEKKTDTPEPVNTAALLFIPLETRIAKTAVTGGGTAAPAGGAIASATAAASPAKLPADAAAAATPAAAAAATAAANDAVMTGDAAAQAPQALLASGLPAASGKDRAPASTAAAPTAAGDDLAAALPAAKAALPASAPNGGQAQQFSGRDEPAGGEAREIMGMDTRVDAKPGSAKTFTTAANDADKAADKASVGAAVDTAPSAAGQRAGAEATTAGPSLAIGAASAPLHANAAASSPAAAATPSQAALTPEVGSGEWGKALGQHMVHMGKAGEHVAELQLNPPGLGPLKVTLSMNDNQVQALFVSAHSSVRAAVEAALPQLRSTLADSGISLGDTSVNSGSQQQATFAQNQNGQAGDSGARGQQRYPGADAGAQAAPAPELPARRASATGVDTYA